MGKKIRLTESQLDIVIKNKLLNEDKGDIYKQKWTPDDTILTLYCAKYPDKLDKLGFRNSNPNDPSMVYDEFDDLANHIIGSTGHSLKRQVANIQFLMGLNDSQSDYSVLQEKIFNKFGNIPEDKLRAMCQHIVDNADPKIYEEFLAKKKEIDKGRVSREIKKQADTFKKDSEDKKAEAFKRLGKDMSKFKSVGTRPIDSDPPDPITESKEPWEISRDIILSKMGL